MKMLALEYLDTLSVEGRRANGQIYTPSHLVDFVLEQGGYAPERAIDRATILDPACGAGAFLERAVATIAERLRRLGIDIATRLGRQLFLETIASQVYGVDIDPQACALARAAVQRSVFKLAPGSLPAGYFVENVIHADFLLNSAVNRLRPMTKGGFTFIVGNPPYVSATRISAAYKKSLRRGFITATGRLDLYTVFIERSLLLLSPRGRLSMITPDKFLTSQTARPLRDFILARSSVRSIAQFRSHKVFPDAATVPCVMVLERDGFASNVEVLQCADQPTAAGKVKIVSRSEFPQVNLKGAWQLKSPEFLELVRRIQATHPTVSDCTVRVSAGPATGRDGLFVFPTASDVDIEHELLRPAVRGRDIGAYSIEDPKLSVLLPYVFDRSGESKLIRLSDYPKAARYLRQHRADLERRHCVRVWGKAWYDLHDQVPTDLAKQVKVLVPDVANSNRFAVDRGRFFPLHSAYYLIPKADTDPDFLVAVLNSRIGEFMIRLLAPIVKDGFSRYRRQFLTNLPIPTAAADIRARVVAASRMGETTRANALVSRLFSLSDLDRHRIEQFLSDRYRRDSSPSKMITRRAD